MLKPDVVFFEEALPAAAIERAFELARRARLLLVVGSSLEVHPVAGLPELTLAAGGDVAIVNRGTTPFDRRARIVIDGRGRRRPLRGGQDPGVAASARSSQRENISRP